MTPPSAALSSAADVFTFKTLSSSGSPPTTVGAFATTFDADFIAKQEAILRHIQQNNAETDHSTTLSCNNQDTDTKADNCFDDGADFIGEQQRIYDSIKRESATTKRRGSTFKIRANGQKVRVKNDAHEAVKTGKATLAGCLGCRAVLQVSASAKHLYCTVCGHVSPMNLACANLPSNVDELIATSLQKQEIASSK